MLGCNFETSPGTLGHTLIFPGAAAGLALCFFEPRGCCLLCTGQVVALSNQEQLRNEMRQVAKEGRGAGESWNKCPKVVSVPVLVGDAGVVWGDGQGW